MVRDTGHGFLLLNDRLVDIHLPFPPLLENELFTINRSFTRTNRKYRPGRWAGDFECMVPSRGVTVYRRIEPCLPQRLKWYGNVC